ncbi:MAG TPA: hypothetical protein ENL04_04125 [Sulfuricurvum sp.]|nr:hypothetical protein [Sulfuricurvum sp.]
MIKKKQNGKKVWVTFTMSPEEGREEVALCGSWNDWAEEPMKLKKNGEFYLTKVLPAKSTFEFGYKVNNDAWLVESECPQILSPFGTDNAVLEL